MIVNKSLMAACVCVCAAERRSACSGVWRQTESRGEREQETTYHLDTRWLRSLRI